MKIGAAQAILQGSKNLDKMKMEIEFFFKMVGGLVGKKVWEDIKRSPVDFLFWAEGQGDGYWRLEGGDGRSVYVTCYIDGSMGQEIGYRMGNNGSEFPHTHLIQTVYCKLDVFLFGMAELDLELEGCLRPFLDASKIQL